MENVKNRFMALFTFRQRKFMYIVGVIVCLLLLCSLVYEFQKYLTPAFNEVERTPHNHETMMMVGIALAYILCLVLYMVLAGASLLCCIMIFFAEDTVRLAQLKILKEERLMAQRMAYLKQFELSGKQLMSCPVCNSPYMAEFKDCSATGNCDTCKNHIHISSDAKVTVSH